MARLRWLLVPVLLAACTSVGPPAVFLHSDFKPWNDWMDTVVDVDLTNVALGSLATRSQFEGMNVVLNGVDPDYRITLQAEKVTRRQALWQLANQYGLALTVGTTGQGAAPFIIISNRETRREIVPLK
jgi:hypothetical protein